MIPAEILHECAIVNEITDAVIVRNSINVGIGIPHSHSCVILNIYLPISLHAFLSKMLFDS